MHDDEKDKNIENTGGSDNLQKDRLDEFFSRKSPVAEADRISDGKQKRQLVVPGNSQHKLFTRVGVGSLLAGIAVGLIIVFILSKM